MKQLIRYLVPILFAVMVVGCTTQTGGTASVNKDQSEKTFGAREMHEVTVTTTSHTDGTSTVTAKHVVLTSQPTTESMHRNNAKTFQGSVEGLGDNTLKVKGGEAGSLGDFSAVSIQKNAGNWILMLVALGCGVLAYFVMQPPQKYFAILACVAVAILAMLAPTVLWMGAVLALLAVIGWWIASHGAAHRKIAVVATDSVTRIIDDHPALAKSIKDSAARSQAASDPVIAKAVKQSWKKANKVKMTDAVEATMTLAAMMEAKAKGGV